VSSAAHSADAGTGSSSSVPVPVVELREVTVRHGNIAALNRVSASLLAGEITCVLGENGSGKSTLVAVLSGLRRHDEGELRIEGTPMRFRSVSQARALGIATIWQDLAVAPLLSVWRNFFLGVEPTRGVWPLRRLDIAAARETTVRAMARVGVTALDPEQPASSLKAGERQSLAVARALHFGARALLIDEPVTPMTMARQVLFGQTILAARSQGLAVVVVTNNPRYAHLIGDRFLLLAHGQVAGILTREDVDADDLTALMAGGEQLTTLTDALTELHPELGKR
jgi:simple sugar transport system ATP-binding protein